MTLALVTLRERLDDAVARLSRAGIESARVDAEWLLAAALGVTRGRLVAVVDQAVNDEITERYETWIQRRAEREPLQYILGTQAFRDLTIRVGPSVLVPRPETEMLVSWALELLPPIGTKPLVLDVGTGSGCIACALASERPDVRVIALDASAPAAALARENVRAIGLADRITVSVSDLFEGLVPVRADLIVSNPPYVPGAVIDTLAPEITEHEPRAALDGGPDGLRVIRRLVTEAPKWLRPGAPLVLETFGDEQVGRAEDVLRAAGFDDVSTRRDLAGITRFVCGRRAAGEV
ncbi:MAG TPA: peptide chain release factor N(5)-glutamine methyltransferase [Candidatus Acidoferrum sp.]|nr:peptide chain release factor N(5)-glutamine methyltransferase [Candidatus Acidoferrum sp.]